MTISEDQYLAYNILTSCWGSIYERKKHPYFFLTGSAGTRKTFLTLQIINYLKSNNKKHLLMAPTGVAAQNVSGKTIYSELKIAWGCRIITESFSTNGAKKPSPAFQKVFNIQQVRAWEGF